MIVCLSAKQVKEGRIKQLVYKKDNEALNALSLIPQPSLDLQIEKIERLNDNIKALETDFFEFEQQDKKYEEKISEIKNSFEKEYNKTRDEHKALSLSIENKTKEYNFIIEEKNSQYTNKIMIQNDKFNKLLNDEFERYEVVKEEMESSIEKYSKQREEILVMHEEIMSQCKQDYETRMAKIMDTFNELQN